MGGLPKYVLTPILVLGLPRLPEVVYQRIEWCLMTWEFTKIGSFHKLHNKLDEKAEIPHL